MIGRQVSHYYVLRSLGQGGMGVVYEAQDTRLPRSVAIKFLKPGRTSDPEAARRFKREAYLASSINHQNICTIFDVDEQDGVSFIAMELLQGMSLKARLMAGPLSIAEIVEVTSQVARALGAAHALGIVHRDITPGNIFLCSSGLVKLVDFGLAKQLPMPGEDQPDDLTGRGMAAGTTHYMAPEQLGDPPRVEPRSDLFSLGTVLYQMATGARPFEASSSADVATMIRSEPHVPASELRHGCPPELTHIIDTLLQKDVDARYRSADVLRDDLLLLGQVLAGNRRFRVTEQADLSVAVLPFRVVGPADPSVLAFRDGLTEQLTARLAQRDGISVVSRTSVEATNGKGVRDIGRLLRAALVVEGSIQQDQDDVRVVAYLADTVDERAVAGPVEAQVGLASSLRGQLTVADLLVSGLAPRLPAQRRKPRSNPEALQAFKRGQHHWFTSSYSGGWRPAIEYFQDAIARDPDFVAAHLAIARAYNFLAYHCILRPKLAFTIAAQAAERALSIDDNCGAAHTELAAVRFGRDWDWGAAESHFQRAIELDPTDAFAHLHYSWMLTLLGREDAGLVEAEKGLACAPTLPIVATARAHTFYLARRFRDAIDICNRVLSSTPDDVFALHVRGLCHMCLSVRHLALADFDSAAQLTRRTPFYLGLLGLYCRAFGDSERGLELLTELNELERHVYVHPQCYTFVYAGMHAEEKLAFQERAYEHGASPLNYLAPFVRELYKIDPNRPTPIGQMRLIV